MSYHIFMPNKLYFTFRAPNHCAKFHQNCGRSSVFSQTNRLTE